MWPPFPPLERCAELSPAERDEKSAPACCLHRWRNKPKVGKTESESSSHLQLQEFEHGSLFLVVRTDVSSCEVLMSRKDSVESWWWRWRRRRWCSSSMMSACRSRCGFRHDFWEAPRTRNGSAPSVNRDACSTIHDCPPGVWDKALSMSWQISTCSVLFLLSFFSRVQSRALNCKPAKTALTTIHALFVAHSANQTAS